MNIKNIEPGKEVRILTNLSITDDEWSVTPAMEKMKGKIYKVKKVNADENAIHIYDNVSNDFYIFSSEDVTSVKITPPLPPVMFDPENILNEGEK